MTASTVNKLETNSPCFQILERFRRGRRSSSDISLENAEKDVADKKAWGYLPTLLKVCRKHDLHKLYPELFEVVNIIATLPVTLASCERTHSKIKIINNYFRASMSHDRLESLIQITVEGDLTNKIELSSVLDVFKTSSNRRLPL